ncbi:MAG: DUF4249 domain-containing protein [Chitinophagaceae bacterium]
MKFYLVILLLTFMISCEKVISVKLPDYEPEIVAEMYLEEGKPLRCLVSQSLSYTDSVINLPLNNATVVISDGNARYMLQNVINVDTTTGRLYNFYHPIELPFNNLKTYSLTISDSTGRLVTGVTRFSQMIIPIDSVGRKSSLTNADSFSVGIVITDPADLENYYRFIVAKKKSRFADNPTDFSLNDISFNGKPFSFFSEAAYARNDTVTVRVYSLQKEHYDYIQSTGDARGANFNPFSQPGRIKSNVKGGLGIFTAIRYAERDVIIK